MISAYDTFVSSVNKIENKTLDVQAKLLTLRIIIRCPNIDHFGTLCVMTPMLDLISL